MKLYDKLKTEHRVKLATDVHKYPITINELLVTLNEKSFWVDLTIHEATNLITFTVGGNMTITELDELFKK